MLIGVGNTLSKNDSAINARWKLSHLWCVDYSSPSGIIFKGSDMEKKRCTKCKDEKTVDNFGKGNDKDSLNYWCKKCRRIKRREHYLKNKKRINKENIEWHFRNRKKANQKVLERQYEREFGGNKIKALERDDYVCQSCGAKKKLVIHHIDGKGLNIPLKERNNKLNNLLTLCKSCHMRLHKSGEKHHGSKLKEEDVKQIRKLYLNDKYSQQLLGEIFNVSATQIWRIVKRKSWKHVV